MSNLPSDTHHSSLITHHSDASASDMPTVARIRERLASLAAADITIAQATWVFGVSTKAPILLRIERGEISAAKVLGEWMIDTQSINRYLDNINNQFKRI